jgi:hypothetical protein
LLAALFAWFAVAALFKSTNEPLLSNKWSFYTRGELAAVDYAVSRLQNTEIWLGIDERLWEAYMITHENKILGGNSLITFIYDDQYRYAFVSAREQFRAGRTGFIFPDLQGWLRIYDDGDMTLYNLPSPASP